MAVFVAPQPWFELRARGAYGAGFVHFWLADYFEFGASRGLVLPTWNHLWFVAYLWAYSMILAGLALLPAAARARLQAAFDAVFSGWRLLVVPIIWLATARLVLHPVFGETHALADDPYAHAIYGFAFFFGVALPRAHRPWATILAHWRALLAIAALACAGMFAAQGLSDGAAAGDIARALLRAVLAWNAILGLLGLAQTRLHHDGPVRRYLTEAIFPYYIIHQTIIVAVGFWSNEAGLTGGLSFAVMLAATLAGCALTYEIARRIGWLRPLLGLKRAAAHPRNTGKAPAPRSAGAAG